MGSATAVTAVAEAPGLHLPTPRGESPKQDAGTQQVPRQARSSVDGPARYSVPPDRDT